jgi:UPF0755 protein
MKRIFRLFLVVLALGLAIGGYLGYFVFLHQHQPASTEGKNNILYIYPEENYGKVKVGLLKIFPDLKEWHLTLLAEQMNYTDHVKPGRYVFRGKYSLAKIMRKLKSAEQDAVRFSFVKYRNLSDMAGAVGKITLVDSNELRSWLADTALWSKYAMNPNHLLTYFIPNTYELYWTTSTDGFIKRMKKEYDRFWTTERMEKAKSLGLTIEQVSVLASIVNEETIKTDEKPKVAGLYWNRVNKGMLLQADPTVKFALGNFELRRIWEKDLQVNSPYNTYRFKGLPPGPINTPSIEDLDAVLNLQKHSFIYMCAKEDFSGYHNFAENESQHNLNAQKYRKALSSRKIYR